MAMLIRRRRDAAPSTLDVKPPKRKPRMRPELPPPPANLGRKAAVGMRPPLSARPVPAEKEVASVSPFTKRTISAPLPSQPSYTPPRSDSFMDRQFRLPHMQDFGAKSLEPPKPPKNPFEPIMKFGM